MHKDLEYRIKRSIDYLQVKDHIYVFQETKIVGENGKPYTHEGFTTINDLEKTFKNPNLGINPINCGFYKKEIFEKWRTLLRFEFYELLPSIAIKEPYSYFKENSLSDVEMLRFDHHKELFLTLDNEVLPYALLFDYTRSNFTNEVYDLEKAYEILKKRNDIRFTKKGIQAIPHYNATDERNKCLEFIWMPTVDDFKKIGNLYNVDSTYHFIANQILGIPKK